jgi:tetratricopeptide (TPR) repeat protein/CHAT domain-containing protein
VKAGFRTSLLVLLALTIVWTTPVSARPSDIGAVQKRFDALYAKGDYAGALVEGQKREAAGRMRVAANHSDYGVALVRQAVALDSQGKYAQAAELDQRALAILEKALGRNHPNVAGCLNNLAEVYRKQGKYAEAAKLLQRALAIYEKALGPSHPYVAESLNNLGLVYDEQGKYAEAVELHQRALAIRKKTLGPSHPDVAQSLDNLAIVYYHQGKYAEAAELHKRALAIREKALGPSHREVANNLDNLANVYYAQDKYAEAVELLQRALAIKEKALGPNHPDVADSLNNLANAHHAQGKYAEAVEFHQRALAIREKALGPSHPEVAYSLNNLAIMYQEQGNYAEAVELLQRALAIREKAFGPSHPDVAKSLDSLAFVYQAQGKYAESVELNQRALAIREKALGPNHPRVAASLNDLALVYRSAGKADLALAYSRRATAAVLIHTATGDTGGQRTGNAAGLIEQRAWFFVLHVANLAAAGRAGLEPLPALGHEGFETAQWAVQSSAGAAVQQMALRFASGDNALATLVRDNQDLAAAWRGQDKALIAALSKPEGQQDRATLDGLRRQIAATEAKLAANEARLDKEFPDYAALAKPKPLAVEDAQKLLSTEEALVFILPGDKESYVFALTRDAFDWQPIPLDKQVLAEKVSAFRHGLDVDALNKSVAAGKPELFDLNLAQELYASLLGSADALIKDKRHLLIVPSGPLTALPFHLLVTQKFEGTAPDSSVFGCYRDAAWLIKRQAVTILPSVPSLKALRFSAHTDAGAKPLIGFGDPLFRAEENVAFDSGKTGGRIQAASRSTRGYADYWQGAELDRARPAEAPPLPDTADELKAVAKTLGAPSSDIYLGADASETNVKRAPLADYRVVYFATHALVAGDIKGLGEPALLLSVPKKPNDFDDGLLTASEVAQLKLNADWVVLSACNTAAGDKPGAEALSGLARAFFYAGARALLVSHWAVDSKAATRLTTSTFDNLTSGPAIGRAEALRRAMLAYMNDASEPRNPYPAYWAPFSVVGEGAAR